MRLEITQAETHICAMEELNILQGMRMPQRENTPLLKTMAGVNLALTI